jgi:hypothetical protein
VDRQLRRAIFALGLVAHLQQRSHFSVIPGAADAMRRPRRGRAHGVADAQAVERANRVGREVDVGADAQELAALFENNHVVAFAMQRDGRRQSADAAANNSDPQADLLYRSAIGPDAAPRYRLLPSGACCLGPLDKQLANFHELINYERYVQI